MIAVVCSIGVTFPRLSLGELHVLMTQTGFLLPQRLHFTSKYHYFQFQTREASVHNGLGYPSLFHPVREGGDVVQLVDGLPCMPNTLIPSIK